MKQKISRKSAPLSLIPYTLFLFLTLQTFHCFSQLSINFSDTIKIQGKAFLLQNIVSATMIDSATIVNNRVVFHVPDSIQPGLYNATFYTNIQRQPVMLPVLITKAEKQISITTSITNPFKEIKILHSPDNEKYYAFLKEDYSMQQKQKLLSDLIPMYSQNDSFYLTLTGEMLRIKQTKDSLYNSYLRKPFSNPVNSLIKRQIEVAEKQFTPINPVAEPLFLNSTVLMQWVWSYLFQYKNETLGREEQAKNYMNGIDTLANMFNTVPDVRSNIFIEVGKAFEQSGYDEVSLHIYEVYLLTNTCHADEAIKIKAENLKNIQVGKTAPDILFDNMVTDISSLYKIKAKYTLLVFWASWCSHCRELIPKLAEFYKEANMAQNNAPAYFQVLAISLDTSKQEWVNYQIAHNLSWYNYSDLKAWKSKVAEAYCVSSTPTMFLLNEDKKIIAKPISVAELLKELKVNK